MRTQYRCMEKTCGILISTNKEKDGINCPKCKAPVMPEPYDPNEEHISYESIKKYMTGYKCLKCNYTEVINHTKKEYSEVKVCPNCRDGAFVDKWKILSYIKERSVC
ncbi:hypothetical protein ACM26V_00370 [Salipaludibacillus sp. HK11]|uniref:hypothetical protein n=1 Tax=Salipaludibacillus sp. HK11 TaxID=3394320 RepID=UPI0039FD9AEA